MIKREMDKTQQKFLLSSSAGESVKNAEVDAVLKDLSAAVENIQRRQGEFSLVPGELQALTRQLNESVILIHNLSKKVEKLEQEVKQKVDYSTLTNVMLDSANSASEINQVNSSGAQGVGQARRGPDVELLECPPSFPVVSGESASLNSASPTYSDSSDKTVAIPSSSSPSVQNVNPRGMEYANFCLDDYMDIGADTGSASPSFPPVDMSEKPNIPVTGVAGDQSRCEEIQNSSEEDLVDFIELIDFENSETPNPSLPGVKDAAVNTEDGNKETRSVEIQCNIIEAKSSTGSEKEATCSSTINPDAKTRDHRFITPVGKIVKTHCLPRAMVVLTDLRLGGTSLYGGDHVAVEKRGTYNTRTGKWTYVPKELSSSKNRR